VTIASKEDFALLKKRKRSAGRTTTSRFYTDVTLMKPQDTLQLTWEEKAEIWPPKAVDSCSIDPTHKLYARLPKAARGCNPLSWFTRDPTFLKQFYYEDLQSAMIMDMTPGIGATAEMCLMRTCASSKDGSGTLVVLLVVNNANVTHEKAIRAYLKQKVLRSMATPGSALHSEACEDELKNLFPSLFSGEEPRENPGADGDDSSSEKGSGAGSAGSGDDD